MLRKRINVYKFKIFIMKEFGTNDVIFARAMVPGMELFNIRISGIDSEESLFQTLKHQIGNFAGLVNLNVRNLTQGWAHSQYWYSR